jgi:hypothetical protein
LPLSLHVHLGFDIVATEVVRSETHMHNINKMICAGTELGTQ